MSSTQTPSPGTRFRALVAAHQQRREALQVAGSVNAYFALLAEHSGFEALYLSGGGVAACSCGIPDLGITTLEDVLIDARRITNVTALPLLVDIDTGWGGAFNIARAIRALIDARVAAIHIEDQVAQKRCGHRPNKAIVSKEEMCDRVKAAADARTDANFVIMARTDALAVEGLQSAIDRACAFVEAGADMIFPEAMTELDMYRRFVEAVKVPVLANITEFGSTPLFTVPQLSSAGVAMALYPLSTFRSAAKAALETYQILRREGTQVAALPKMQTRAELYEHLGYHAYEQKLDQLFSSTKE